MERSNQSRKEPAVERRMRAWYDGWDRVTQRMSAHSEEAPGGGGACWMLPQGHGGPKLRGLGEGRALNQSLADRSFVPIDQWDKTIQLLIYKVKNGYLQAVWLALS